MVLIGIVVAGHLVAGYLLFRNPAKSAPAGTSAPLGKDAAALVLRLQKEPCNRALLKDLALKLLRANEYSAVLNVSQDSLQQCGASKDLLPSVFSAHMGLGNFKEAESAAETLIAEYPADPSVYGWRSQAREKQDKITGAYEDMLKALSLFPDPAKVSVQVYYDAARLAARAGYPCEAIGTLRDYLAFDMRPRRTQQIDTLMKDWQKQGSCAQLFGNGSASIRYSTRASAILVPVEINGVRARMVLDTGATMTLVSQAFANRSGIEASQQKGGVVVTANGRIWVNGGRAETMSLGDASLKNVPLHVQDAASAPLGEDVDGLLGLSFLGNFQVRLNNGLLELRPLE